LTDYQVIVETIAATTTETGLTVTAVLDPNAYPAGVRISDALMKTIPVQRYAFHGEWNYVIVRHEAPLNRTGVKGPRSRAVAAVRGS
jgi:CO dehydrogenase/acetyl-CoA synthase gamma subunit (corrinoid Fe-S protein)